MDSDNERGRRYIAGLFHIDEDERLVAFRGLIRDSITDDQARGTAIQIYQLVGDGECDRQIGDMFDTQMVLTSIEENPALLPFVEPGIEKLVSRFEARGSSFRGTWVHIRARLSPRDPRGQGA